MTEAQWMSLVSGLLLLILVAPRLLHMGGLTTVLRWAIIWLTIFGVIGVGYVMFGPGNQDEFRSNGWRPSLSSPDR